MMDDLRKDIQIAEQRVALSRITERYPPDTVAGRLAADVLAKYPNRFENADRENDSEPFEVPEIAGLPLASLKADEPTAAMIEAGLRAARKVGLNDAPVTIIYLAMSQARLSGEGGE
jgi:hypothetical protein